jgi:hypothetical protein
MRTTFPPRWYLPALFALAIATPGVAQEPSSRAADKQMANVARMIKVTGCVKQQTDVPELKPAISLGQGDEFALSDVTIEETAAVPVGTTGTVSEMLSERAYALTGEKERELKAHVGHQVEITGSLDTRDGFTTARRSELAGLGTEEKLPRIKIQSFRLVTDTCSAATKMHQ